MVGWLLKPFAIASGIALSTLGILGQKYAKAKFAFNLTIYSSVLGLTSIWGVFVTIFATATGQRFNINYYVARSFYHVCSPLVGIRLHVEGEEHLQGLASPRGGKGQSAVLIGNHQSFMDILYLGRILPKKGSIMAKKELKWIPLLGQFMTLSGAVMVDRKDRAGALKALQKAGEQMKRRGVSLWVFPEGTRTSKEKPTILPFKKGAFHLAVQAQVPIVPVVCENYHRLFDGRGRMDSGDLRVRVLPPISTEGLGPDDVSQLAETTREAMLETLIEISAPGPSRTTSSKVRDNKSRSAEAERNDGSQSAAVSADSLPEVSDPSLQQSTTGISTRSKRQESPSSEEARGVETDHSTEDEMDDDAVLLRRPLVA